ncbi:MAG TPA: universal stress protein [Cytophagaceae bacterium]|jgi:nucleotide-binding universal stress UspA family protein|nr:universal stress protein [Cytophagaceae bacterium]
MKQILVATDFSNCASNAMEYAMELAKILNLEVCAIHAIGTTEGIFNNTYNALYIEDYYANKRQALAEWANVFSSKEKFSGVKVHTLCEVGSVSSVLSKHIDQHPVELLVMGTIGSTGITGLFGSNVSVMVEKTKTPTLIIPSETKFSVNPVITLATDFSSHLSPKDVIALNELIVAFRSETLTVLNVLESPEWKTNEAGEEGLKKLIENVTFDFKYISENSPVEGIMNFIVSNETDILCVVKHHHNLVYRIFNKSTINKVMNRSIKAILILHE